MVGPKDDEPALEAPPVRSILRKLPRLEKEPLLEDPAVDKEGDPDLAQPQPSASLAAPEKDPAADEDGFIPLGEALRRLSGGDKAPSIVPNWISSNFSSDGDVGLEEYRRALLELIDKNKVFPKGWTPARSRGMVQVVGDVDGMNGQLLQVRLAASSGNRELDRAALQTIINCNPFPAIGSIGVLHFQVGITYGGPGQSARR